jgi:phage terminase small subunit
MAAPKKPRLTQRERLLLKALATGATYAEAAKAAGYSERTLRQSGFQAVQRIKAKLPDILDAKGLTDELIVDKYLRPGLEAMETEFGKFNGKITDSIDVIAWGPRLTALDMLFRLKGSYAPKEITGAGGESIRVLVEHIGTGNPPSAQTK